MAKIQKPAQSIPPRLAQILVQILKRLTATPKGVASK